MIVRVVWLVVYMAVIISGAALIAERSNRSASEPHSGTLPDINKAFRSISDALQRRGPNTYIAARPLEAGHRLRVDDLARPDSNDKGAIDLPDRSTLVGKYLRTSVRRGGDIRAQDVDEVGLVTKPDNGMSELRIWLGTERKGLVSTLDVGWRVDVCDDESCVVKNGRVLSIQCRDRSDEACLLVLEVSPAERNMFLASNHKNKLSITISEPPGG
jgi:hypothetical protein